MRKHGNGTAKNRLEVTAARRRLVPRLGYRAGADTLRRDAAGGDVAPRGSGGSR